jgi:NAD+ synthase
MDQLSASQLEYCRKTISEAIASFVKESGARGAVVAVSGGVDSALVLALASAAVDVHALIMPEDGVSDPQDVKDAEDFAKSLKVPYSVVDIRKSVDSVMKAFPWPRFGEENKRLASANVKPRLRMTFDYLLANLDQRVVLGTSNRTELLLGYFTKYGDGGCDFEPIGSLYKTHVRQLACLVGVPEKIVAKAPSAGLWPGQTDEDEIGATYEVMDDFLSLVVDGGRSAGEAARELGISSILAEKLRVRWAGSGHKRMMPKVVSLDF